MKLKRSIIWLNISHENALDNNLAERAIKPFVIGRKNWLFHGNEIGAHAGSILFSLIETCKQHQIEMVLKIWTTC